MKWLTTVVWWSLTVVWSRAVDELALRRPCAPCPPPLLSCATHRQPASRSHLLPQTPRSPRSSLFSLSCPSLSETVAIISILLLHYNSSGNVRSFSHPPPNPPPFIIVFRDISRFFLPRLCETVGPRARPKLSLEAAPDPNSTNERGCPRGDKHRKGRMDRVIGRA